jgi:disulfide bond formation protein DsbB
MRKKSTILSTSLVAVAGVLAIVAFGVACGGGGGDTSGDPTLAAGEKHFMSTCATCHGRDGRGMPKLGKDLHDNKFTQDLSDDELVAFLIEGRPAWDPLNEQGVDMPPRGGNPALTDENLMEIVAYLRTFS